MSFSYSCLIFSPLFPIPPRSPEEGPEPLRGLAALLLSLLSGVAMQTPAPSCIPTSRCSPGAGSSVGRR